MIFRFLNIIESSNQEVALVPFPYLDPQDELPLSQPTDSEASICAMDSSISGCNSGRNNGARGSSDARGRMASAGSLDDKIPPSSTESTCRISYQDEMHSVDIETVDDPASCIKRILDGLVAELKEEASANSSTANELGCKPPAQDKQADKADKKDTSLFQQHGAKRLKRNEHDEDNELTSKEKSQLGQQECEASPTKQFPPPNQLIIETIMTWMDTFQDSESIQLHCLQSLPSLLEHNALRYHAQTGGLASIVFYNMAAFPKNFLLQLTAFHTLVVLLRPLGASEGTIVKGNKTIMTAKKGGGVCGNEKLSINRLDKSENNVQLDTTREKSNSLLVWEENGVRVMLDTLRSYSHDRYLQAMGCWAMVNAALYPSLKQSLLRLGGVYVVTNAMMLHPNVEAVQFRGLFALINFVIPDSNSDKSPIQSHVYQIARLTIIAMKNFQTNKSILNRGCLVLRNLSLTSSHVPILARTPGCIDMLLHCRQVCSRDALVQRSARTIMIIMQRNTEKQLLQCGTNLTSPRGAASISAPSEETYEDKRRSSSSSS